MDSFNVCPHCIAEAMTLILVANGSPIIARKFLGSRLDTPVDFNLKLVDGHALFGQSKTWRGVFSAVTGSIVAAFLLGLSLLIGALFGLLAMLGDLVSSFIKRRMGLLESSRTWGLDVLPEALLPMAILRTDFDLDWANIVIVVLLFFLVEVFISPILFQLHIRNRPY